MKCSKKLLGKKRQQKRIKMKIAGFSESYQDWDGYSWIIYTAGCNYKCPTCHSKKAVNPGESVYSANETENFLEKIRRQKNYIKKVVICGGEPTLQPDLPEFLKKLKEKGLAIKLDTNGSNPDVLANLLEEELVNYVAMDIKGPPSLYSVIVGGKIDLKKFEKGIGITENAPDYEFRTTVVPIKRGDDKLSWMTWKEAEEMAKWVHQNVLDNSRKWYIQPFVAKGKEDMLDERFSKENLPAEMHETPVNVLEMVKNAVSRYFPNTKIRE